MGPRLSPVLPPAQRPAWDSLAPPPVPRASHRRPVIVGHRGAQGLAPENTLAAFQVAIDLGLDGVEFDVQRTADGHLVVIHDETVNRTTDGQGVVADMTLAALQRLDAGRHFDPRFAGERIPTLREVFDLIEPSGLLLFVELKDPWRFEGIEAQVAALIRAAGLVERVQVRAFYHAALHTLHRLDPAIALSELWFDRLPSDDEITLNTVNVLHRLATDDEIARLHRRGVKVTAWTVDDLDEARRLIAAGIDGLTTNVPNQLLTLFED